MLYIYIQSAEYAVVILETCIFHTLYFVHSYFVKIPF